MFIFGGRFNILCFGLFDVTNGIFTGTFTARVLKKILSEMNFLDKNTKNVFIFIKPLSFNN